ncbi:hypothetical protein C1T17_07760 [Sphingobium sp. SCG-1]|uniref:helix-turn-helix domain-containing protein n=1 Tax=Sphingobium sp. SCG-1 TaxID=2072936 RepID=UPI000CD6A240|nr:helix-turn-helix domain-containing protein [Sphingobium sp. SCG-1]AUW58017.1 hypothetical protein C1T17_07760 [Sphingobium sp. SCG-1]
MNAITMSSMTSFLPPVRTPAAMLEIADPEQKRACALLHRIVAHTGLSITEIARAAGLSPSTLTRIYPTPSVSYTLSMRTLTKIHAAFPDAYPGNSALSVSHVPDEAHVPLLLLGEFKRSAGMAGMVVPPDFELYTLVPDTAQIQAPPYLTVRDMDRFVTAYVPGNAMAPRIKTGEMLLIDKIKPAPVGTDVLVSLRRGEEDQAVTIGTLLARDRDHITLQQGRVIANFDHSQIGYVHLIVAVMRD